MEFTDKVVLVTGGTGSFGQAFTKIVLEKYPPRKLIIFSRDEQKQYEMAQRFPPSRHMRYFLGDVRDRDRLHRAFHGVDIVVHAAALKHVPAGEYNPCEVVKTNVFGSENVINASIDQKVKKVIALSTDKAANPINLYGATKLCADKLVIAGNSYSGDAKTMFSVVRYGNVIGSRGSIIPYFRKLKKEGGKIPVTDKQMTRFWITLEQGVEFVMKCLNLMQGGEIFIPKIPSMKLMDLIDVVAPGCEHEVIGIRPGEKLHETMIPEDEARNTIEYDDYYIIRPNFHWSVEAYKENGGRTVGQGFKYTSDSNTQWLTKGELKELLAGDAA